MNKKALDKIIEDWGDLILPVTDVEDGDDVLLKEAESVLLAKMPNPLDEVDEYWFFEKGKDEGYKVEGFNPQNPSITLGSLLAEVKSTIKYVVWLRHYQALSKRGFYRHVVIYEHPDWESLIDNANKQ